MPKKDALALDPNQDSTIAALQMEHHGDAYYRYKLDSMTAVNKQEIELARVHDAIPIQGIIAVFIPIIAILASFWVVYRSIETKRAIKLALIEKGMDAAMLAEPTNENSKKYAALRYGLLLCGLGLGLLVGMMAVMALMIADDRSVFVIFACATLGGGLGMVVYHIMAKRADQK